MLIRANQICHEVEDFFQQMYPLNARTQKKTSGIENTD